MNTNSQEFYETIQRQIAGGKKSVEVVTALDGDVKGQKCLVTEGDKPPFGKDVRVFRERLGGRPKLVICGGGHVSIPIIRMGQMLDFKVTVLEDRPKFADHVRTAGADQVFCLPYREGLEKAEIHGDTYVVIVTRGHRYDGKCLYTVLSQGWKYAYIGMMGSRRRVAIVKEQMAEAGISREVLEQVHTPIGLAIGAETPEEIAVSVFAEIIEVKNKTEKPGGYTREVLKGIFSEGKKKVLATIISRKGSAPRSMGTKMVICEDGATFGTIGGGCAESDIIRKSLFMLRRDEEPEFCICRVDMTSDEAEDAGMVCGGTIEVMLEKIG